MWSEEELRDIPDVPPGPRTGARALASALRHTIATKNVQRALAHPHELTRSSVIYAPTAHTHGNFIEASYRRILANPAWSARLRKAHTARRQARPTGPDELTRAWNELDTATSSDALLMNIFCYPRVLASARLTTLLGIPRAAEPVFGFHPGIARQRALKDRTEVDLRLAHLLIEAKLTESNFQSAPLRLLERYADFDSVFDLELLPRTQAGPAGKMLHYQLLRGVLAAHTPLPGSVRPAHFCVLVDARRPDLIDAWYSTIRAVRSFELQSRLRLLTWQELLPSLPGPLRDFLADKYDLHPAT